MLALLSQLPEDPINEVISGNSEAGQAGAANGQRDPSKGAIYDPAIVYLLELSTVLALRDSETVNALGAEVVEALQNVIRNAAEYHHIIVSRAMFYLLNLLHATHVSILSIYHIISANFIRNNHSLESLSCFIPYQALRKIYLKSHLRLSYKGSGYV